MSTKTLRALPPLRAGVAALCLATGAAAPAQTSSSQYETWQSPAHETSATAEDAPLKSLVVELKALIDAADRDRAADRRFLRDLRDLVRKYDYPWDIRILSEDFTDGRVAETPEWNITAGEFRAEWGLGLRSVVRFPAPAAAGGGEQRSQGNQQGDLAAALLGALLEQATRKEGAGEQSSAPSAEVADYARIHVAAPVTNAFSLDLELVSKEPSGHLELSFYQRDLAGPAYTLAYRAGEQTAVELLRAGSHGTATIYSHREPTALEPERPTTLQWTRDRDGQMVVSLNGKELMRSSDRGLRDPFDGFAITNRGGDLVVRGLRILGAR